MRFPTFPEGRTAVRLPRLKLRVGTLLIAVAAFALGIWADRAYNRYNLCMRLATRYQAQVDEGRKQAESIEVRIRRLEQQGGSLSRIDQLQRVMEGLRLGAVEADRMRSQALRAAWFPFIPVPLESSPEPPSLEYVQPLIYHVPSTTTNKK